MYKDVFSAGKLFFRTDDIILQYFKKTIIIYYNTK